MFKRNQILTLFIGLAVLVITVSKTTPSNPENTRTIRVTGNAEIYSLPERAYIEFSVKDTVGKSEDIADVLNDIVSQISDIELQHIEGFVTTYLNGYKNYETEERSVDQTFRVIVGDISIIDDLLGRLINDLDIYNYRLVYIASDVDKLENRAYSDALDDATTKAQYLASETGNVIGEIVELQTSNPYHSTNSSQFNYDYSNLTADIDLQDLSVRPSPNLTTLSVTVTYELK